MSNNSLEDIQNLEQELSKHSQNQLDHSSINFDDSVSEIDMIHSPKGNGEQESPFQKGTFGKPDPGNENKVKRNMKPLAIKLEKTENDSGEMNINDRKTAYSRRQRSLNKTEVVSPVKLSLKRKKSRKITWKQVEEALNQDDNRFRTSSKNLEVNLDEGDENKEDPEDEIVSPVRRPHNPNEDTSTEKSPITKNDRVINLNVNPNEITEDSIAEDEEEEAEEESVEDDIIGDQTMQNIVEKKGSGLNKIINRICYSNQSSNQSRRSIMNQKKDLKFKIIYEDE